MYYHIPRSYGKHHWVIPYFMGILMVRFVDLSDDLDCILMSSMNLMHLHDSIFVRKYANLVNISVFIFCPLWAIWKCRRDLFQYTGCLNCPIALSIWIAFWTVWLQSLTFCAECYYWSLIKWAKQRVYVVMSPGYSFVRYWQTRIEH